MENDMKSRLKGLLAGLLVCANVAAAGPAFAGQADIDFLKSYIGEWRGRGTAMFAATGQNETVVCRLNVVDSANTKVAFDGRCSLAGRTIAVAGTVAWVEAASRYEAIMSSVASFQGVAIGQRRGDDIAFNLVNRNADGRSYEIDAGLSLQGGVIQMDFQIKNVGTGEITTAQVPFSLQ